MKNSEEKLIPFIKPFSLASYFPCRGWGCGYVAIPISHKFFNVPYDEIPVTVHGGLTWGEIKTRGKEKGNLSENRKEILIPGVRSIPYGYYIVGFDTAHFNDSIDNCPKNYVIEQTFQLYEQLVNLNNGKI